MFARERGESAFGRGYRIVARDGAGHLAPAVHGAVGGDRTGVVQYGRDGGVGAAGRVGLAVVVGAPAGNGAVVAQGARGVIVERGDGEVLQRAGGRAGTRATNGDGGAGEPASDRRGCGEVAGAGELSLPPGVVAALLESEFDSAVGEFPGDDARFGVDLLGGGGW